MFETTNQITYDGTKMVMEQKCCFRVILVIFWKIVMMGNVGTHVTYPLVN